jgi:hypothetical protein
MVALAAMNNLTKDKIINLTAIPDFQMKVLGYVIFTLLIWRSVYWSLIPFARALDNFFQL